MWVFSSAFLVGKTRRLTFLWRPATLGKVGILKELSRTFIIEIRELIPIVRSSLLLLEETDEALKVKYTLGARSSCTW